VRFDVCLVDHLHVCRFARTRDDFCKTDGDDDFRSSNGSGEARRQREWYELTSLDRFKGIAFGSDQMARACAEKLVQAATQ
jgi:hypothetical protein